jgi:hypothetical protein
VCAQPQRERGRRGGGTEDLGGKGVGARGEGAWMMEVLGRSEVERVGE